MDGGTWGARLPAFSMVSTSPCTDEEETAGALVGLDTGVVGGPGKACLPLPIFLFGCFFFFFL